MPILTDGYLEDLYKLMERLNAVKRQLNLTLRLADAGQLDTASDLASALMRDSHDILDDTLLVVRTENATQQQRNNQT